MNNLYSVRCGTCGGVVEDLADDEDWDAIYRQIAENLLSGADYKINADLHLKTAKKLCDAIGSAIEPSDEDRKRLIVALQRNIYPFSAAKSFQQMAYYRDAMVGDDGKILGKDQFIKKIADTGEIFNKKYLAAEYENAYYSAIMADKWDRFGDDEYLQYSTVGDSHVRPSHAVLDKYTAPKSDSFWKNNYPPNGWGCRCTVIPGKENFDNTLTPKQAGNQLKAENKDTPFYNNVGASKVIFDGKHPYFQEAGGKIRNMGWKEYGMKSLKQIYTEELPEFKPTTKEEYLDWWVKQKKSSGDDIAIKDVLGDSVILESDKGRGGKSFEFFKDHVFKKPKENRFEYATETPNVLRQPDEIWDNPGQGRVYLKYYENGILKVAVNDGKASTIFKLFEKDSGELDFARKGTLLYK